MPFYPRILSTGLLLLLTVGLVRADTLSERTLKDIVARQKDAFARVAAEKDHPDVARLRGELQSIINSYDILIQSSPDFAAAYVAYGLLLGQVGMTREAVGMLIKANKLDPDIPLVKNEMARFLAEDGKPAEALPWLMAAIALEPKEPIYHYHLGKLLTEGRDDLIATGQFTRATLDRAMLEAYRRGSELAPDNFAFAYRYAEAFYDLETPRWDEAIVLWSELENRAKPGVEQQTVRLHAANVFLKMGRVDHARALLITVNEEVLQKQKQTLLDELAKPGAK